eukprot:Protomagalhaensia_wolfi_Nauph_80__4461@NODE_4572_length_545_cov_87_411067_g3667_i0_p2_GENE_NODE_4572_length_545_cov_87_411067_g3667_i0NODE_4572_length_545_cov_87_411067_g3667_i0_p2_ORF_typecomplete_len139_score2_51_NODE_4572_length_545_cov_87_411067_g3667_i081497
MTDINTEPLRNDPPAATTPLNGTISSFRSVPTLFRNPRALHRAETLIITPPSRATSVLDADDQLISLLSSEPNARVRDPYKTFITTPLVFWAGPLGAIHLRGLTTGVTGGLVRGLTTVCGDSRKLTSCDDRKTSIKNR